MKDDLFAYLKRHHRGRDLAITVKNLAHVFECPEREIREALRELNLEGKPVLTSIHPPYGVFYAWSQDEVDEYRANLVSRLTSLKERIDALDRILLEPIQMELFG